MAVLIFVERLKPESIAGGQSGCISVHKKNREKGTVNQKMNQMSKELWEFLKGNGITITVEYLPGKLNTPADK